MQQLCNGIAACNPGRREQHCHWQEWGEKAIAYTAPPWIWPFGSESIAEGSTDAAVWRKFSSWCSSAWVSFPFWFSISTSSSHPWTHQSFCRCIGFPNHHCDIYRGSSHSSPFISLFVFSDLFPVHLLELLFLLLCSYFSLQMTLVISLCLIMLKPQPLRKLFPLVSPTIWNSLFFLLFLSASTLLHLFSNLVWKHLCSHDCAS